MSTTTAADEGLVPLTSTPMNSSSDGDEQLTGAVASLSPLGEVPDPDIQHWDGYLLPMGTSSRRHRTGADADTMPPVEVLLRFLGLATADVSTQGHAIPQVRVRVTPHNLIVAEAQCFCVHAWPGVRVLGGVAAVEQRAPIGTRNPTFALTHEQLLVAHSFAVSRLRRWQPEEPTREAREAPRPMGSYPTQRMHPTARELLVGAHDEASPLSKLDVDIVHLIFERCREAWRSELAPPVAAGAEGRVLAYEHVSGGISHPRFFDYTLPPLEEEAISVNMMPFVLGDRSTLPSNCWRYWPLIMECASTLPDAERARVCYLTVSEGIVRAGSSGRRAGLHTEGTRGDAATVARMVREPDWHPWGIGMCRAPGRFDGGIFMASNVSDSCVLHNVLTPTHLVGPGGSIEHLREELRRAAGSCGAAHREAGGEGAAGGPASGSSAARRRLPTLMRAHELYWLTDRTPHESLPLSRSAFRQYFRLVCSGIGVWYAAHSTANPLGTLPDAPVVTHDKFSGREPPPEEPSGPALVSLRITGFQRIALTLDVGTPQCHD